MKKKSSIIIALLLLISAYLIGSAYANSKYGNTLGKSTKGPIPTTVATVPNQPTSPPFNPAKSNKPEVKFFVMSFCPYGNQAESGLEPVFQLLKDKVKWSPGYLVTKITDTMITNCKNNCPQLVFNDNAKKQCNDAIKSGQVKDLQTCQTYFPYGSTDECIKKECDPLKTGTYLSLHGPQELNEDVREIVAYNMGDLSKWWKFVTAVNNNCTAQNADSCWTAQATSAGLNAAEIYKESKSEMTTLLDQEISNADKAQAQSSPTVIINGTLYNGDRSAEGYKKAICSAFADPPLECANVLGQNTTTVSGGCHQ